MAKLSHDDSSWRAHGLKKRYAEWDPDATPKKKKSKKDTKKWCRGVEGHPHDIRDVVIGINPHCWDCRKRDDGKPCPHMRSIRKCIKCNARFPRYGTWSPKEIKIKEGNLKTEQQELAAKWCTEGHLWDWKLFTQPPERTFYSSVWDRRWYRWSHGVYVVKDGEIRFETKDNRGRREWGLPKRLPRTHKYCVMCGLERKSQSREITPEDIPKEFWRG